MKNIDSFTFGDIVLAEYNFSDGSSSKLRPVLVLFREKEDYTVLKMTSQKVTGDDILTFHPTPENRLKIVTYLHMRKINTFHETLFLGKKLGSITEEEKQAIQGYLIRFIEKL